MGKPPLRLAEQTQVLGDRAERLGTLAGIDILTALNVRGESIQVGLRIRLALEALGALGSSGVDPPDAPARNLAVHRGSLGAHRSIRIFDALVPAVVNTRSLVPGDHESNIPQ